MGIKQLYNDNLRKLPNEYGDVSVMNSFSSLMMFSIDFENDLVLLHSRAIPVFHFIDV